MASPGVTKVSEWGAVEMLEKEMKNQGEKVLRLALKDEVCTKCYSRTVNILLSVLYFLSPSVSTVRSSQYHRIIFLEPIKNRDCFRHCVNASGSQLQVLFSEVLSSFSCACTSQAIGIIRGLFFCNFFKMLWKISFFFSTISFSLRFLFTFQLIVVHKFLSYYRRLSNTKAKINGFCSKLLECMALASYF